MNKFRAVKIASILGIIGNLFLLVIKGIIGFLTNSQSMMADAINSAGDIFSSIMTFIGNRVASQAADNDHNLGHGKAEYIYSMLISIVMFLMTYKIVKDSVLAIFNSGNYIYSNFLIIVCIITILIKFCLFVYTNYLYKKYNNILIKTNSIDHRNDCLLTFLNLVACILTYYNIKYVDSIVGIFIALWIFYSSLKIFIESYDVLMDKAISDDVKDKVLELVSKYSEVCKVTHFNSTPVGYQYQISFTIFVDGNMSTFESHNIANSLEKDIDKNIDEVYLTVIHVNPM